MGKGLAPLVTGGAGVRTQVSLVQVLVSGAASFSDAQVPADFLCTFRVPPPPRLELSPVFLVSSSQLRGLSWILPRGPSAIQVVPAAKACPTLDVEGISLYLMLLKRLQHLCVQHLYAIFGTTTGYPEAWHHFRKCLSLGVGGRQAANGM